jgi:uncharacterized protein (UPF0335 family)
MDLDNLADTASKPQTTSSDARAQAPALVAPKAGESESASAIAGKKLRSFIEKIERLEAEKADLATDIREVYAEAKGNGFDTKIMRQVIKLRKLEEPDRKEQDELLDLYRAALEI